MTLLSRLTLAKTEEDVKDAYIAALGLKSYFKGLVDIQTEEIWFEAKDAPTPSIIMFGHLRGRPTWCGGGRNGSRVSHSSSVKSFGKPGPLRACRFRVASVHIVDPLISSQNPRNQPPATASSATNWHHST